MPDIPVPQDAELYPKTFAARLALAEIAQKYIDEYDAGLHSADPAKKLEKKIFAIQKRMAEHARTFICSGYNAADLAGQIAFRRNLLLREGIVTEEELASLSPDEEGALCLFAHASFLLHNAFLDQHIAHRNAAVENGHPEAAFEDRIILGTLYAVCREWLGWWRGNGSCPFERWNYEDAPYDLPGSDGEELS